MEVRNLRNAESNAVESDSFAETAHTRHCPTVCGEPGSLITHVIGPSICMKRQRELYHKCHRCDYRGQAADFVAKGADVSGVAQRNGAPRATAPLLTSARRSSSNGSTSNGASKPRVTG